jgi:hypothetical protein
MLKLKYFKIILHAHNIYIIKHPFSILKDKNGVRKMELEKWIGQRLQ